MALSCRHTHPLQVAGMYPDHIFFVERSAKKLRVQIYDILKTSIRLINVEYHEAALSFDGKHLLAGYGQSLFLGPRKYSQLTGLLDRMLSIIDVQTEQVVKSFKTQNLRVRARASNSRGFYWVDNEDRFFFWSYRPFEEPNFWFRLQSSLAAPRGWLTAMSSPESSWYAMCATENRRIGVVHCCREGHSESKLFNGPSAVAFTHVMSNNSTEAAVILASIRDDPTGYHVRYPFLPFSNSLTYLTPLFSREDRLGRLWSGPKVQLPTSRSFRRRHNRSNGIRPRNLRRHRFRFSRHNHLVAPGNIADRRTAIRLLHCSPPIVPWSQ